MSEGATRRPRAWVAAALSLLITPGLGHLYAGAVGPAVIICSVALVLRVGLHFVFAASFRGLVIATGILVTWSLFATVHAVLVARRRRIVPIRWFNHWSVAVGALVAVAAIVGAASRYPRYRAFRVPSAGMAPTLVVGDYLMADLAWYRNHAAQRGDLVVFELPTNGRRFIKRCVGVAGDIVEIRDKTLYVNGEPAVEPYVQHVDPSVAAHGPRDSFGPIEVPADHVFMLGDNRDNSHDSRFWGPVPFGDLDGKALYLYASIAPGSQLRPERFGRDLSSATTQSAP